MTFRTKRESIRQRSKVAIFVFAIACVFSSAEVLAVEAPYIENFDSYSTGSTPNNFTTFTKGAVPFLSQWSVTNPTGTSGVYENHSFGDDVITSAAVNVTNLANSDFILSTTFVINSYGTTQPSLADIRVGLTAFAFSSDLSLSGCRFTYEIFENGGTGTANGAIAIQGPSMGASNPSVILPVSLGTTYTMTLTGHPSPSGLVLTGTVSDANGSISVSITDPGNSVLGDYFGYYDLTSGQFNRPANLDVSYDNFSINVPEPRIGWLVWLGGAFLGIAEFRIGARKQQ